MGEGAFTGTFRGSSLAFAAARACMRFARENDLARQAAILGGRLRTLLSQAEGRSSPVAEVRGRGLMLGAEIVDPRMPPDRRGTRPPASELTRAIQRTCFDRGLIVEVGGAHDNVVRFLPPLTVAVSEIELIGEIFCEAVEQISRSLQTGWGLPATGTNGS